MTCPCRECNPTWKPGDFVTCKGGKLAGAGTTPLLLMKLVDAGLAGDVMTDIYRKMLELETENKELRSLLSANEDKERGEVGELKAENKRLRAANEKLGSWMSAALEDGQVCEEMKRDIRDWFAAKGMCPGWKWHCRSCGTLTNDGECDCTLYGNPDNQILIRNP